MKVISQPGPAHLTCVAGPSGATPVGAPGGLLRLIVLCYVMFITPGGTKPKGPYTALPNQYIHLKHNSQKPIQITFEHVLQSDINFLVSLGDPTTGWLESRYF